MIKDCIGYELEKEKSNTSEDFFNRSELTFVEDGEERTLHVLYVRYFEEIMHEFTPYQQNPILVQGELEVSFKDIVALVCLLKNPGLRNRKRIYINSKRDFALYFQDIDYEKLADLVSKIKLTHNVELRTPLDYIVQTS